MFSSLLIQELTELRSHLAFLTGIEPVKRSSRQRHVPYGHMDRWSA